MNTTPRIVAATFMSEAKQLLGNPPQATLFIRFQAMFGINFDLAVLTYLDIRSGVDYDKRDSSTCFTERHLLMGLHFLKIYASEAVSAVAFGVSDKTFRKWSHLIIQHIADLKDSKVSRQKKFVFCSFVII